MEDKFDPGVNPEFKNWISDVSKLLFSLREVRRSYGYGQTNAQSQFLYEVDYCKEKYGTKYPFDLIYQFGQSWTVVMSELMAGLGAIFDKGEVTFPGLPLIRMVQEYSARVVWLLGDEPTVEQRAARALLEEAYGCHEMATAGAHTVGSGHPSRTFYRNKLKIAKDTVKAMFPESKILNNPSQWVIIGSTVYADGMAAEKFEQHFASPTETARQFGDRWTEPKDWHGFYEYLCACVHPGIGVLEFFDFEIPGGRTITDYQTLDRQIRVALIAYYQALKHLSAFFGFPIAPVDEMCNKIEWLFPGFLDGKKI